MERAEPFDIQEYRQTIADAGAVVQELNGLVQSTNELLNSPGVDKLMPQLIGAIDEVERTSEDLINQGFLRAALLILLALAGIVFARLSYHWLAMRLLGTAS